MDPSVEQLFVEIARVTTCNDIDCVAALARDIWTQHFTPIIGESQVNYMLKKFQSADVIKSQIAKGWEYYLARDEKEWVGYTGLIPDHDHNKLMISKFYVKSSVRGKGVGSKILDFIEEKCASENTKCLWLTVNRFNQDSIFWYKRRGFTVVDEVIKDIGNGFSMDDYIMEKMI